MIDDPMDELMRRMEDGVYTELRRSPIGIELRRWGFSLEISCAQPGLVARAIPMEGRGWPTLESHITGQRWWEPEIPTHIERISNRVEADFRMKWDRWMAGIGP